MNETLNITQKRSLIAALTFFLGLEILINKSQNYKLFLGVLILTSLALTGEIFWTLGFNFRNWRPRFLVYLILPLSLFLGSVFFWAAFPGIMPPDVGSFWQKFQFFFSIFIRQAGPLLTTVLFYIICLNLNLNKEKYILGYNLLIFTTLFSSFLIFSAIWAFYLYFDTFLPWMVMILIFLVSFLLIYQALFLSERICIHLWLYALIASLILAETAWALIFWPTGYLISGIILAVIFYIFWGLISHYFEETLTKRVVLEYIILGTIVLIIILRSTPWFFAR